MGLEISYLLRLLSLIGHRGSPKVQYGGVFETKWGLSSDMHRTYVPNALPLIPRHPQLITFDYESNASSYTITVQAKDGTQPSEGNFNFSGCV